MLALRIVILLLSISDLWNLVSLASVGDFVLVACSLDVEDMSFLLAAHIVSFNFFPTAAGLDSSAAGFT